MLVENLKKLCYNYIVIIKIHFLYRMFERQDSGRLDYMAEREARHSFSGITQQASVESTDSRLCYLTSSEVSPFIV